MSQQVTALFSQPEQSVQALKELADSGFTESQISMVMTDETRGTSFDLEKGNKAGEGFTIGASLTGVSAAIAAGLASAGLIAIPGINLVAYGPIVAALTAAGAGAATGGVVGGLIGSGIPEYEAKKIERSIKEGAVLLAVDAKDKEQEQQARDILEANDAHKIAA